MASSQIPSVCLKISTAILVCLLLTSCQKKDPQPPSAEQAQDVSVAVMKPQRLVASTELSGRISAFQIAEVRPQVGGIIQKRLFKEGADVQAGDVLYTINPDTYRADLDSAEANLARATANVTPAKLKMQRFKTLVRINAVSKQEDEDTRAAYEQALASVGVCRAEVENARIRLEYTNVTAPIAGRISRSNVTPGALVTENQTMPLTTVQQLDPVYVDITQSSVEVLRLRRSLAEGKLQRADALHAAVKLRFEDGRDYEETGTLQFTDVSVEESTGAVNLRAIFPNPRQALLPGMYVRAVLNAGVDEQALLVPQPALLRDAKGNASVYIVNDSNRIEIRSVSVGRTYDTNWIVLDGLEAGDKVVVGGLQKIRPGSLVHILPQTMQPTADAAK